MKFIYLLICFLLITSLLGFYLAIRPFKINSDLTPAYFHLPFEEVYLQTKDNITLHAWYVPSKKPSKAAIIVTHGYPADKGDVLPSRIFLHENFNLLFLDFRYFGKSGGHYSSVGAKEVLDIEAAVAFLEKKGMTEIGIWGFSLGGAVAIMSAARLPQIKAVVAESSYANLYDMVFDYYRLPLLRYPLGELTRLWGILFLQIDIKQISPANDIKNLNIPILLIHSRSDNVIAFSHAELLQKALNSDNKVEIQFVDDLHHGEPIKDYQNTVGDFFLRHLKSSKKNKENI